MEMHSEGIERGHYNRSMSPDKILIIIVAGEAIVAIVIVVLIVLMSRKRRKIYHNFTYMKCVSA